MSMWLLYLILRLNMISNFLVLISLGSLSILIGMLIVYILNSSEKWRTINELKKTIKPIWKFFKPKILIALIPLLLSILIPTTKQAAAIYFVPKVINNKQISKMPDKLVTLANSWMDEQIKSIKSEGK